MQRQHLEDLRQIHQGRLNILEKQAASFGLYVPPHVLTEIKDEKSKIAAIDLQLFELQTGQKHLPNQQIITILFLSADPADAVRLRLGEELREIHEKLQLSKRRDLFRLEQRMSVRPADFTQAILDTQPQIVHFSGHGSEAGALCFENLSGVMMPVAPDALSALFKQFSDLVNCVLLNACFSENQAKVIAEYIDYVIGIDQEISDRASIAFSIGFYQALGSGSSIEEAYNLGCGQIGLQGISENSMPMLIKKVQLIQ